MMHAVSHRIISLLFCTLIATVASTPLLAQGNLLDNPGFDTDLSGWENRQNGQLAEWATLDASNSPLSGSALISNETDPGDGKVLAVLKQCIPAVGSREYTFGSHIRLPPNLPADTLGRILVRTFNTPNCTEQFMQVFSVESKNVDVWTSVNKTFITDSTTGSIDYFLSISKPNGVSDITSAYFDNPFLRQSDAPGNRIIDEKLSGAWYNPATDGQGIYLDISTEVNMFIGGWFTWADTLGEIDWMTVQGGFSGEVATLTIYHSSGGKFNDPAEVTTVPIGIGEFRFSSCTEAEFAHQFDGESEFTAIPMVRAGPAFKGCVD